MLPLVLVLALLRHDVLHQLVAVLLVWQVPVSCQRLPPPAALGWRLGDALDAPLEAQPQLANLGAPHRPLSQSNACDVRFPGRADARNRNPEFACHQFVGHQIYDSNQGHGLGFGDITGNGRGDFILNHGWLESPEDTYDGDWKFHADFDLGSASVPILVVDVNGDGLNDLIVGQAHPYGLDWWEQQISSTGKRTWVKHPIDPYNSQYHDIQWIDIDGDGKCELVTGKRYRAHCGNDPGANDDLGIYYFKWNGESFSKQIIDYGPAGTGSGCGIYFHAVDINNNGLIDIVAPGKDGLYLFQNLGIT